MKNMWKLVNTDIATVGELFPYGEPDRIVAANMEFENPVMPCRKLLEYNDVHKQDIRHELYRKLGDCQVLNVIYGKGSARVLVSINA